MDSVGETALADSKIINEVLSGVTHRFDSPPSPRDSEIILETAV